MRYAPTVIDLSRVPVPQAIEGLDYESLLSDYRQRFLARWNDLRQFDPTLPEYDTLSLETDPGAAIGQVWSSHRLLDRQRVNDAFKALLPLLSKSSNLDSIAARRNIQRRVVTPATSTSPAVMETDAGLLRRYLLSFDVPAAGSAGGFLFDAWTAWPEADDGTGMLDARVNGYAIHGRRGDVDLVITGPGGAIPALEKLLTVRDAVTGIDRAPEGVAITILPAVRVEYAVSLVIEVPEIGPAPELIRQEAIARVTEAARERLLIGGEIPAGYLAGAAYGPNIIKVRDIAPVVIAPDPYEIPVMTSLTITPEVR